MCLLFSSTDDGWCLNRLSVCWNCSNGVYNSILLYYCAVKSHLFVYPKCWHFKTNKQKNTVSQWRLKKHKQISGKKSNWIVQRGPIRKVVRRFCHHTDKKPLLSNVCKINNTIHPICPNQSFKVFLSTLSRKALHIFYYWHQIPMFICTRVFM